MFILQTYALLVTFNGFPVFEIRKNLDLRKILSTPKIFLKSRFHCTQSQEIRPQGLDLGRSMASNQAIANLRPRPRRRSSELQFYLLPKI